MLEYHMDQVITILISVITVLITGGVTYFFAIKRERHKEKADIEKRQRHEYFHPFKYSSKEFLARLKHIEDRLTDGDNGYIERFSPSIKILGKDKKWYFHSRKHKDPGGYFTTSTIYMNCILFYRMKRIQWEHPFIPLKFEKRISELLVGNDKQILRCLDSWKNDLNKSGLNFDEIKNKKDIDIDEIIECIRVPLALRGGIPYSLHDSYGDFITSDNEIMNYEEFVEELIDDSKSIKFQPIIEFWTNMIQENVLHEIRVDKLRKLIIMLQIVQFGKVA